jgi:hypothetical protein
MTWVPSLIDFFFSRSIKFAMTAVLGTVSGKEGQARAVSGANSLPAAPDDAEAYMHRSSVPPSVRVCFNETFMPAMSIFMSLQSLC